MGKTRDRDSGGGMATRELPKTNVLDELVVNTFTWYLSRTGRESRQIQYSKLTTYLIKILGCVWPAHRGENVQHK